ncbi:uncharacterized protein LOC126370437 [Pectinophora gossypiella]|uniref:uncharacterized protein LOC126370437 n=1 Tax=Pectinophora gossypiella TaxID=13191 RepID=UPI00214EA88D|nr:uncharacterized protein LOC126370437 [Pectinophora gossypiella]
MSPRYSFQEDEVEDLIGEVKYTDSQKSVATISSNQYSTDFTDTSSKGSDKNHSSGKETYVLEWDSDSEKTFPLHDCLSTVTEKKEECPSITVQCGPSLTNTKVASTSFQSCAIVAQEIYTQTSKTIIELAESEGTMKKPENSNTLETQTSFISITENKTVEYRIEVSSAREYYTKSDIIVDANDFLRERPLQYYNVTCKQIMSSSMDEESSKFPKSETENEATEEDNRSVSSTSDQVIRIINDESKETIFSENQDDEQNVINLENTSQFDDESIPGSDMDEDSLMGEDQPKAPNKDVRDLHNKLSENIDVCMPERYDEPDIRRFGTLTPLTEESNIKKDSLMDITPTLSNIVDDSRISEEVLFTSNAGMKVKLLKDDSPKESFKLPPIQNHSCPNSPHLNSLFNKPKLNKAGTLPSLYERPSLQDRWEMANKDLASGESPLISGRGVSPRKPMQLPPLHAEGHTQVSTMEERGCSPTRPGDAPSEGHEPICIKEKIKELKMSTKKVWSNKRATSPPPRKTESRSCSPVSACTPDEARLCDIADRGCEALCGELLRRLRSSSWFEVIETLEDVPKVLEKFWNAITEQRIADLVRVATSLVESPRPQVARAACSTVAAILRNTNYTKKPDFYEAMTSLLTKTGSYSRPVRRAANVALDDIVCGVELTHAVSALCVHGVGHKNALVRCASARLLVVCCALAGGGRDLLRARPPTAATARRHTLRALSALLDDKSTDTRKYAERLYSMLRPLSNFEAYYLTDVEVEQASKQMKKYDQQLNCGAAKEVR